MQNQRSHGKKTVEQFRIISPRLTDYAPSPPRTQTFPNNMLRLTREGQHANRRGGGHDHLCMQFGCHKLFSDVCIKISPSYLLFCQPSTRHMSFALHFISQVSALIYALGRFSKGDSLRASVLKACFENLIRLPFPTACPP